MADDLHKIAFVSSAPGKLILAGEHSVVHHTKALASVVDKRTFAEFAWEGARAGVADEELVVELDIATATINEHYTWTFAQLKQHAEVVSAERASLSQQLDSVVKPALLHVAHGALPTDATKLNPTPAVFLLYYFGILRPMLASARGTLRVHVASQLPIGAGLGSSASFTASLSGGFLRLASQLNSQPSGDYLGTGSWASVDAASPSTLHPCVSLKDAINYWAYEGERILHGNPSGLDNTTVVHGGVVLYRKARAAKDGLEAVEALMRPLTGIPSLSLLVVNTRVPRNTAKLVAGVGQRLATFPRLMRGVFDGCEELVEMWLELLQPVGAPLPPAELEARAGELMRRNQDLLQSMGVGHDIITRVLALAEQHGLVGKLTGAGGGGCLIILKPTAPKHDAALSSADGSSTAPDLDDAVAVFTSQLAALNCEYLETVVGQAGVWVKENATIKELTQ